MQTAGWFRAGIFSCDLSEKPYEHRWGHTTKAAHWLCDFRGPEVTTKILSHLPSKQLPSAPRSWDLSAVFLLFQALSVPEAMVCSPARQSFRWFWSFPCGVGSWDEHTQARPQLWAECRRFLRLELVSIPSNCSPRSLLDFSWKRIWWFLRYVQEDSCY